MARGDTPVSASHPAPLTAGRSIPRTGGRLLVAATVLAAYACGSGPVGEMAIDPAVIGPPASFARVTPPSTVVDAAGGLYLHDDAPVVLAEAALPLRLYVERPVVNRYGLEPVRAAAREWTVPGSSVTIHVHRAGRYTTRQPRRDGTSRVFADPDCDRGTLAYTSPQTDRVTVRDRSVAVAWEVDIGVCDAAPTGHEAATAMFLHELGHALGLAHQCPYPTGCWQPGMPTLSDGHRCRTMTAHIACPRPTDIDALDAQAIIRTYPQLPRLGGSDPADTAAWVAWHLYTNPVEGIVVLADDATDPQRLQATVQAATRGWPLLTAASGPSGCHASFAAELRRLSGPHTVRHTYGDPPPSCRTRLAALPEAGPALPDRSRLVLLPDDAVHTDGWLAAYAAARLHATLTITADADPLDTALLDEATTIVVITPSSSPPTHLTQPLRAAGHTLERISTPDDVDRLTDSAGPRGIVAARMSTDGPAAIALAVADDLQPVALDHGLSWRLRPHVAGRYGYVVGGPDQVPHAAHSWLSQLAAGISAPQLPNGG